MYTKDDVTRLIAEIGDTKNRDTRPEYADGHVPLEGESGTTPLAVTHDGERPLRYIGNRDVNHMAPVDALAGVDLSALEFGEPYMFGLALDAYDPVSGQVFVVCRPHIQNSGQPEIFVTLRQLAAEVSSARLARIHSDRAAGILTPDQQKARDAANEKARADQKITTDADAARIARGEALLTPAERARRDAQDETDRRNRIAAENLANQPPPPPPASPTVHP